MGYGTTMTFIMNDAAIAGWFTAGNGGSMRGAFNFECGPIRKKRLWRAKADDEFEIEDWMVGQAEGE